MATERQAAVSQSSERAELKPSAISRILIPGVDAGSCRAGPSDFWTPLPRDLAPLFVGRYRAQRLRNHRLFGRAWRGLSDLGFRGFLSG